MKKLSAFIIACAILVTVMVACSSHSHEENINWSADAAGHWKLCEECGEKSEVGDHSMDDAFKCTVCGSEIIDWGDSVSVYIYDEHENPIRMADYDVDGNIISETVYEYEYDGNGKLTKSTETVDGQLCSETEYTVTDGESNPSKCTYYNEDGSKFINGYDSNGNVILLIDYDADGNITLQVDSQFALNSDGEWYETARTETYSDGMKIDAEYNEHYDAILRIIYDVDGNVTSTETWEYTYGDNDFRTTEKSYMDGNLVKEIVFKSVENDDGLFNYPETVTTYDENGDKTVSVYDENSELISETKYNASGDNNVERKGSAERFGFFMLDTTIAKIDSLGKTEENKRLVELYVNEVNYYVSVSVYTWSDPEKMYDTCETYYFYNSDSGYIQEISLAQSDGKTIAEKNYDELWLKYESTGESDSQDRGFEWGNLTYSDVYNAVSSYSFFEIVE